MIISSLFTGVLVLDRFEKLIHVKQLLQKKKKRAARHASVNRLNADAKAF